MLHQVESGCDAIEDTKSSRAAAWLFLRRCFERATEAVVIAALVGELLLVLVNMILRQSVGINFTWSDEASKLALIVMAFIGGAVAYRRGDHLKVRAISDRLSPRARAWLALGVEWVVLDISALIAIFAYRASWDDLNIRTPQLHISQTVFDVPIVIGMVLIAIYAIGNLMRFDLVRVLAVGLAIAAVGSIALYAQSTSGLLSSPEVSSAAIALLALLLLLGVPMSFAFLGSALTYFSFSGSLSPLSVPVNMQEGVSSFVLLAIPFFILAGAIMSAGGLSARLAELATATIGRWRNGLLQVIVVTMYLFSGLSGSKAADIAAVGAGLRNAIRAQGYASGEIVAVLSSSAVMAETVPPSIALLVLSSAASLSPSALFVAGIVPAAVVAVCLMAAIALRKPQTTVKIPPASPAQIGKAALRAVPALLMPLILGRGILTGLATPTEMSSIAVMYGLLLAGPLYRQLDPRKLLRLLLETVSLTGMILLVVAAATAFSRALLMANVPAEVAQIFSHIGGGTVGFLIVSTLALVVLGQILEGIPAILVFAPLVIPIAVQSGVDPIQAGIVLVLAIGLGAFTPPFGVGLYVACAIGQSSVETATRAMLPYMLVLLVGLSLVAFVPWFTLALPRFTHMIP